MADPVTLQELGAALLAAIGGNEGLRYLFGKYKARNGSGHVTREFCGERHNDMNRRIGNLETQVGVVAQDVKEILKRSQF